MNTDIERALNFGQVFSIFLRQRPMVTPVSGRASILQPPPPPTPYSNSGQVGTQAVDNEGKLFTEHFHFFLFYSLLLSVYLPPPPTFSLPLPRSNYGMIIHIRT